MVEWRLLGGVVGCWYGGWWSGDGWVGVAVGWDGKGVVVLMVVGW